MESIRYHKLVSYVNGIKVVYSTNEVAIELLEKGFGLGIFEKHSSIYLMMPSSFYLFVIRLYSSEEMSL